MTRRLTADEKQLLKTLPPIYDQDGTIINPDDLVIMETKTMRHPAEKVLSRRDRDILHAEDQIAGLKSMFPSPHMELVGFEDGLEIMDMDEKTFSAFITAWQIQVYCLRESVAPIRQSLGFSRDTLEERKKSFDEQ